MQPCRRGKRAIGKKHGGWDRTARAMVRAPRASTHVETSRRPKRFMPPAPGGARVRGAHPRVHGGERHVGDEHGGSEEDGRRDRAAGGEIRVSRESASNVSRPSPGQEVTSSTANDPLRSAPASVPPTASSGAAARRSACRHRTWRSLTPARARRQDRRFGERLRNGLRGDALEDGRERQGEREHRDRQVRATGPGDGRASRRDRHRRPPAAGASPVTVAAQTRRIDARSGGHESASVDAVRTPPAASEPGRLPVTIPRQGRDRPRARTPQGRAAPCSRRGRPRADRRAAGSAARMPKSSRANRPVHAPYRTRAAGRALRAAARGPRDGLAARPNPSDRVTSSPCAPLAEHERPATSAARESPAAVATRAAGTRLAGRKRASMGSGAADRCRCTVAGSSPLSAGPLPGLIVTRSQRSCGRRTAGPARPIRGRSSPRTRAAPRTPSPAGALRTIAGPRRTGGDAPVRRGLRLLRISSSMRRSQSVAGCGCPGFHTWDCRSTARNPGCRPDPCRSG